MDGRSTNQDKIKNVRLFERDYSLLRDIYEFYYIDFSIARKRYYSHIESDKNARHTFNVRALNMKKADLISAVPFFSERRKGIRGSADYAYTLTKRGLQALADFWDIELDWDTSRKTRKSMYIIHHLNVLYYVSLYTAQIMAGQIVEYAGEQSSRFQQPRHNNLKQTELMTDFVKPDASVFWKTRRGLLPWLVEYERNSRAAKDQVLRKLQNHADYAKKGLYLQHRVLKENNSTAHPIFLLYCENEKVAEFRVERIRESGLTYYDYNTTYGYGDILFGIQYEVEADPHGKVYRRITGDLVSVDHVNFVHTLSKQATETRLEGVPQDLMYQWVPSYLATRSGIFMDGFITISKGEFQASFLVRYLPASTTLELLQRELHAMATGSIEKKLSQHPLLKKAFPKNVPRVMIIVDTIEQEEQVLQVSASLELGEEIAAFYVSRRELVEEQMFGAVWMKHGTDGRVIPIA